MGFFPHDDRCMRYATESTKCLCMWAERRFLWPGDIHFVTCGCKKKHLVDMFCTLQPIDDDGDNVRVHPCALNKMVLTSNADIDEVKARVDEFGPVLALPESFQEFKKRYSTDQAARLHYNEYIDTFCPCFADLKVDV